MSGRNDEVGSDAPVDMDWLRECTDGDLDAMKEMVALYFSQTRKQLSEVETAIGSRAADHVRRIAHACAGSSGTCGMVAVARHWRTLEQMGAGGSLDGADAVLSDIKHEFERTRAFVTSQGLL